MSTGRIAATARSGAAANPALSARAIADRYYGTDGTRSASAPPPAPGAALTPSSSFVLTRARRLLAQADGEAHPLRSSDDELKQLVRRVEESEGEQLSAHERELAVRAAKHLPATAQAFADRIGNGAHALLPVWTGPG